MTEYLQPFASIMDDFFKGLSDCGLLSSYVVELQSDVTFPESSVFRSLMEDLITNLQNLLTSLPHEVANGINIKTEENEAEVVECGHHTDIAALRSTQTSDCALEDPKEEDVIPEEDSNPNITRTEMVGLSENSALNISTGFHCDECDIQFNSLEKQKRHRRLTHTINNEQICDLCNKTLSSINSLKTHFKKVHKGVGSFPCEFCRKRFVNKNGYIQHVAISHKGKKEAVCPICNKEFTRLDYFKAHLMIHQGTKNYICRSCPKRFVRKAHLIDHEKIHTGDRPWVCNLCGKGFIRSDRLKDHVARHLKNNI